MCSGTHQGSIYSSPPLQEMALPEALRCSMDSERQLHANVHTGSSCLPTCPMAVRVLASVQAPCSSAFPLAAEYGRMEGERQQRKHML